MIPQRCNTWQFNYIIVSFFIDFFSFFNAKNKESTEGVLSVAKLLGLKKGVATPYSLATFAIFIESVETIISSIYFAFFAAAIL